MTALLLDTCALIWLGFGDESLSMLAKMRIEEAEVVYVSPVSLWEISNEVIAKPSSVEHSGDSVA